MFFQTIRQNFAKFYKAEIDRVNAILTKATPGEKIPDVGDPQLTRKDIVSTLNHMRLLTALHLDVAALQGKISKAEASEATRFIDEANTILHQNKCAPFSWVEPHAAQERLEAPAC
jgi:hypothetical protein